jgi:hypothetical protein
VHSVVGREKKGPTFRVDLSFRKIISKKKQVDPLLFDFSFCLDLQRMECVFLLNRTKFSGWSFAGGGSYYGAHPPILRWFDLVIAIGRE